MIIILDRLKQIRISSGLNQADFGKRLGVSGATVSRWESGEREISDSAILLICEKFGVSESWLRTGDELMFRSREIEVAALTRRLMSDSPESFRRRLVETLLKFDPDGPEWAALEKIYRTLAAELAPAPDDSPPDP